MNTRSYILLAFLIFLPLPAAIVHLDSESQYHQIIKNDKIVIVDFYADWCGPCRQLNPIMQSIAQKYPLVTIIKVNIEDYPNLSSGLRTIPALYFFKNGKQISVFDPTQNKTVPFIAGFRNVSILEQIIGKIIDTP